MQSIPSFDPTVEGAIAHFEAGFLERYGAKSAFVKSLSDLLTIAMAKTMEGQGKMPEGKSIVLLSGRSGVATMGALAHRSPTILEALFQEPFGYSDPGSIETAVGDTLGPHVHEAWVDALEHGDHERCSNLLGA